LAAESQLASGRWQKLLHEALTPTFREAAQRDPSLREALWLPLTVAAWDMPEVFFQRFDWALDSPAESAGARAFWQACQLRETLAELSQLAWLPVGFTDLVRFGRVSAPGVGALSDHLARLQSKSTPAARR
jgi:hypothetical protein